MHNERRAFITGLIALLPATAAVGTPAFGGADLDPVFAAIANFRAAADLMNVTQAEYNAREGRVTEAIGTRHPSIIISDAASQEVTAWSYEQIDRAIPADALPDTNAVQYAAFNAVKLAYDNIMRDAEEVSAAAYLAWITATRALVETVPTTRRGLAALLEISAELKSGDHRDCSIDMEILCRSALDYLMRAPGREV